MPPDPLAVAECGSRELDAVVAERLGWKRRHAVTDAAEDVWQDVDGGKYPGLPHYTTSVDAALSLAKSPAEAIGILRVAMDRLRSECDWHMRRADERDFARLPLAIVIAALAALGARAQPKEMDGE